MITQKVIRYTIVGEIDILAREPGEAEFVQECIDKIRELGTADIKEVQLIDKLVP